MTESLFIIAQGEYWDKTYPEPRNARMSRVTSDVRSPQNMEDTECDKWILRLIKHLQAARSLLESFTVTVVETCRGRPRH